MIRWARLTWQAPDTAVFAGTLAERLGAVAVAGGLVPDASVISLAGGVLEVRPWIRESATDEAQPGGRLVLEPVPGGEEEPALPEAASLSLELAAIGWATVELDRAETELGQWLGAAVEPASPIDPQLGAHARVRLAGGLPGKHVVLLEPSTEGRVAASLARDGEGPCAIYLRTAVGLDRWAAAARDRGVHLGHRRVGPLGRSALVHGAPAAGPHLILVDPGRTTKPVPGPSTIAP